MILLAPGSVPAAVDQDHGLRDRETIKWATPEMSMREAAKEKKAEKQRAQAEAKAKADAQAQAARKQLEEARLKAEK
ncbi:MAG: hypothetical protein JST04_16535 [Bdellovibrionales bacterium]|nr:hypothetical protein [Bdellovibrionales bacterium]